jgi:cold shock CspA family protein
MTRTRDSFNKKDQEKARLKKRKEKDQKKEDRKANSRKGKGLDEMLAYVDFDGNIVSAPPDPRMRQEINLEDIQISVSKRSESDVPDEPKKGVVTFFNESKGYGFIKESETKQSVFFHIKELEEPVRENDQVAFETERGPKGINAVKVRKYIPTPK